jgi:hypothetical protein
LNFTHTDRLCKSTFDRDPRTDTAPAECEPDEVQCEYEREPVMSKGDLKAVAFIVGMAALGLVVLGVMWWIRNSNS